jgi:DNA-binding response OmpR family regulator
VENMNNITVLIVDDEQRMRKLIKDFLLKKEYNILEAEDGEKAIQIFEENKEKINIILLDVMMPKLDGWSVLRKVRQESCLQQEEKNRMNCLDLN